MATTTGKVTVRALTADDLDGLVALVNLPGYRFGTARLPYSTRPEIERWVGLGNPDVVQLVAEQAGTVIGNITLWRGTGRRAHAGVIGMGVHDDHVGQGIGAALLEALIDLADNWLDLRRIELSVYIDNDRGIRLYERYGFEMEGRFVDYAYRDGAYVDAFAMARIRR